MTFYPTDDKPNTWQVQEAKARFSTLLDNTLENGPQIVTKRGVEAVVVIPYEQWLEYERANRRTLKDLLLAPEARTDDLVPSNSGFFRLQPPSFD